MADQRLVTADRERLWAACDAGDTDTIQELAPGRLHQKRHSQL